MKTTHRMTRIAAALLATSLMAGCASSPRSGADDTYAALYDGESTTAYSTAFPVASPQEAYRNGDAAMNSGDLDRALFEYLRGLKMERSPEAEPLYKIGTIHHRRDNHRLAMMAYQWSLEVDAGFMGAKTGLGIVYLQQRQYDQAEQQLQPVVDSGQAPWQAFNALGVIADIQGDYAKAQGFYEQGLVDNPMVPRMLNNLGYSHYLEGDWPAARQALRQALAIDPGYELAWRNLGLVHARDGDYDFAIEAVARNGERAEALNDIGYIAMVDGRYAEAMNFFQEAMRQSPAYYVTASENARQLDLMVRRENGLSAE
ncbi:tetratricopeptide repeat protein [Onishia taeanensis]